MTISEKSHQIVLQLRGARGGISEARVFPLADAISDILWKAFSHRWDTRYADIVAALSSFEMILLRGWRISPENIAKAVSLVREAITNGYEWHTPLAETVDRRTKTAEAPVPEGACKLKYAIRFSDGSFWIGSNTIFPDISMAKRYATVRGARKQGEEAMKIMPSDLNITGFDVVEIEIKVK